MQRIQFYPSRYSCRDCLLSIVYCLLICLLSTASIAQKGNIRGFVYDKSNGEAVIFTNVYLKGTTYGAATDINGFYSITKVPVGGLLAIKVVHIS